MHKSIDSNKGLTIPSKPIKLLIFKGHSADSSNVPYFVLGCCGAVKNSSKIKDFFGALSLKTANGMQSVWRLKYLIKLKQGGLLSNKKGMIRLF
jgi:hypothetical protein